MSVGRIRWSNKQSSERGLCGLIIVGLLSASVLVSTVIPRGRSEISGMIPDFAGVPYDFFTLSPASTSPVLTAADVTDRDADFVADCHMYRGEDLWYMFFEVYSDVGGDIGFATSSDGFHWTYGQIVLDEPFHLSYPQVFSWDGEYYMLPESHSENELRLYRATDFPYTWTFVDAIVSGHMFVDASIFRYDNKWWLFAPTITPSYYVYLYYSDNLADPGSWLEHPSSPIVVGDAGKARGGGRTVLFGGDRIIRLSQKCDVTYGEAVRAFEVDTLTETSYSEHEVPESPILAASGSGWNEDGMHCADPWWIGDRWLVVVDCLSDYAWSIGMYVSPQITEALVVSNPSPRDGSTGISLSLSQLSFDLTGSQGRPMSYIVATEPDIGGGSGTNVGDGRYSVPISGLTYGTTYSWFVHATDGTQSTDVAYTFTTLSSEPPIDQSVVPDWSSVIYDPFDLSPAAGVTNPVLKASDVTDRSADMVFAPFLYHEGSTWWMFMCVSGESDDIGLATSSDGYSWTYLQVVLDEPFRVSVPQVFKYDNVYYMLAEAYEINEVRLYQATDFPYTWTYFTTLVSGRQFVGSTVLRYGGTWWLFAGGLDSACYLYYSDNLADPGSWLEHPSSPIVNDDSGKARPGGRSIVFDGNRIIRFAMKNDVTYGEGVRAFQVDTLTKTSYAEHEVPESPVIRASGSGWNEDGMHWIDLWWAGDRWLAAVDCLSDYAWSIGIYETELIDQPTPEPPVVSNPSPPDGAMDVVLNPALGADIDLQGDAVDWWIMTNASGSWASIDSGTLLSGSGRVSATPTDMNSHETKYYWSVNARGSLGSSQWTNVTYTFTTLPLTPPPTPEAPVVSNPSPPDGAMDVVLNPSLGADIDLQGDTVDWWIMTNASGSWASINSGTLLSGSGRVSATPTDMNSYETRYYWSVNARGSLGSSQWTNVTYAFTTLPLEPPVDQSVVPDWSSVIYDPFDLSPAAGVSNPVLEASDVADRSAEIVFAPSLYHEGTTWYMFMCVCGASGDIGLATSSDGYGWTYQQVVLDEPFYLSCPQVFKYENTYYMLTEAYERNEVRLYQATSFPYTWTYVNSPVSGRYFLSPTILRYDGVWWLFAGGSEDRTYLFYSDSLTDPGSWLEHPSSPIVNDDSGKARPGGRPIVFDGNRIIRFAMKNDVTYGQAVRAFQVDTLTETGYAEHEVLGSPIVGASGGGWNGDGMHWVDLWWSGDRWLAVVDGLGDYAWSIGVYETPSFDVG